MSPEIRCAAPHPTVHGWTCNAKLADAPRTGYRVAVADRTREECWIIACPRCGTKYHLCHVTRSAA
jgi:hypothetical protein